MKCHSRNEFPTHCFQLIGRQQTFAVNPTSQNSVTAVVAHRRVGVTGEIGDFERETINRFAWWHGEIVYFD